LSRPFPESSDLQKFARLGPVHPRFWFGVRPPLYPLFMWMFGREYDPRRHRASRLVRRRGLVPVRRTITRVVRTRIAAVLAILFVVAIAAEARTAL
jgi:hypothetical protein